MAVSDRRGRGLRRPLGFTELTGELRDARYKHCDCGYGCTTQIARDGSKALEANSGLNTRDLSISRHRPRADCSCPCVASVGRPVVKAVAVDSLPAARGHSTPSKGGKRKDRQNCKTDRKAEHRSKDCSQRRCRHR